MLEDILFDPIELMSKTAFDPIELMPENTSDPIVELMPEGTFDPIELLNGVEYIFQHQFNGVDCTF